MKTIVQTFDATAVAPSAPILLNFNNIAAAFTLQAQFTGPSPTYSIEGNLGIPAPAPASTLGGVQGVIQIDPNGWDDLPIPSEVAKTLASPTTGFTAPVMFGIDYPVFAVRINVTVAAGGASTGTFKVLEQGIR